MNYILRKAETRDLPEIMRIISQAKELMRLDGNDQWNDGYPTEEHITSDLEKGYGFVLAESTNDMAVCYGAVVFDGEASYDHIEGKWLSYQPFVVIHRRAVSNEHKGKGLAKLFFRKVEDMAINKGVRSSKVDTNHSNYRMLNLLPSIGYNYCGKIYFERGERMAFEKLL